MTTDEGTAQRFSENEPASVGEWGARQIFEWR
jgi:hypothetical protein